MILSDADIKKAIDDKKIIISGDEHELYIGPSSIDLHLSGSAKRLNDDDAAIMIGDDHSIHFSSIDIDEFYIYPGQFWIMSTTERIKFASDICGFVQGRSSIARLGIQVHAAGFVDPGFDGTITLEVTNMTNRLIRIKKGTRICQMVFALTNSPCEVDYSQKRDAKYNGQVGPTLTKINLE